MSLINQMLRDLDARRSPAGTTQLAGLGLVQPNETSCRRPGSIAAWGLAAALLVLVGFQFHGEESHRTHPGQSYPPLADDGWTTLALPEQTPRPRRPAAGVLGPPLDQGTVKTGAAVERKAHPPAPESQRPVEARNTPAQAANNDEDKADAPAPAAEVPAAVQRVEAGHQPSPVRRLTPAEKAERLFAQAQRALAAQHWQRAESLLQQTLAASPGHLQGRSQLASLLTSRAANEAAEQLLVEGLAVRPLDAELVKPYVQLLAGRGALEAALALLDNTVNNGTSDSEIQALRGAILQRVGRHAEAAGAYERALREQPQQSLWWTGLAIAREHNREPQQALRAYQRAAGLPLSDAVRDYVEQRMQALQTGEGY